GQLEIMDLVAPLGPVYKAGTLSGNPLAMAAGLATLRYLRDHRKMIYSRLDKVCGELVRGLLPQPTMPACPFATTAWAPCSPGSSPPGRLRTGILRLNQTPKVSAAFSERCSTMEFTFLHLSSRQPF